MKNIRYVCSVCKTELEIKHYSSNDDRFEDIFISPCKTCSSCIENLKGQISDLEDEIEDLKGQIEE